jgi:putative SOS response-associated peptidase YedK
MCGRFVSASSPALLAERFDVDDVRVEQFEPSYNVAPREQVMIVRQRDERRVLSQVRWGLVPSWAKDPTIGDRMINARAEGLASKRAYRRPFERKRCLVPADGFYEWRVVGPPRTPKGRPRKQPMFVHRRDGEPMAFAGLWDVWKVREGIETPPGTDDEGWLRSCVIVTTTPNELLAPIHDRMPVMLPESAWATWLDPSNTDVDTLAGLLVPAPPEQLELWPVSDAVNSADHKGSEIVTPVEAIEPSS